MTDNSKEKGCVNCKYFVKLYTRFGTHFCFCGSGFCNFNTRSKKRNPVMCDNWDSAEEKIADIKTRAYLALENIAEELKQIKSILDE